MNGQILMSDTQTQTVLVGFFLEEFTQDLNMILETQKGNISYRMTVTVPPGTDVRVSYAEDYVHKVASGEEAEVV